MTYTVESSDVIRDDLCWCSFVTFNTTIIIISSFFVMLLDYIGLTK